MPNLLCIAIEQKRWSRAKLTDAMLHPLAPARMIYVRIHVRIEAIFAWGFDVPGRRWLIRNQGYLHDRLDAFESIFPRHDQTNRRAILWRHRLPVHPGCEDRQRVHSLIQ